MPRAKSLQNSCTYLCKYTSETPEFQKQDPYKLGWRPPQQMKNYKSQSFFRGGSGHPNFMNLFEYGKKRFGTLTQTKPKVHRGADKMSFNILTSDFLLSKDKLNINIVFVSFFQITRPRSLFKVFEGYTIYRLALCLTVAMPVLNCFKPHFPVHVNVNDLCNV